MPHAGKRGKLEHIISAEEALLSGYVTAAKEKSPEKKPEMMAETPPLCLFHPPKALTAAGFRITGRLQAWTGLF